MRIKEFSRKSSFLENYFPSRFNSTFIYQNKSRLLVIILDQEKNLDTIVDKSSETLEKVSSLCRERKQYANY